MRNNSRLPPRIALIKQQRPHVSAGGCLQMQRRRPSVATPCVAHLVSDRLAAPDKAGLFCARTRPLEQHQKTIVPVRQRLIFFWLCRIGIRQLRANRACLAEQNPGQLSKNKSPSFYWVFLVIFCNK
ncbi:MAG: hypothetical protein Q4A28_10145 [Brachymonas sp.]|nr:hypothetical protein [Brachymonas sp.]